MLGSGHPVRGGGPCGHGGCILLGGEGSAGGDNPPAVVSAADIEPSVCQSQFRQTGLKKKIRISTTRTKNKDFCTTEGTHKNGNF